MTPNDKLCEQLRHGIYMDGWDILTSKTESIMKEGAARIKRQAKEIESLTSENERLRKALEWYSSETRWDDYQQDILDSVYDRNAGSEFGHDPARVAIEALKGKD